MTDWAKNEALEILRKYNDAPIGAYYTRDMLENLIANALISAHACGWDEAIEAARKVCDLHEEDWLETDKEMHAGEICKDIMALNREKGGAG